eukprot:357788-Chlamydomonas_euryale.AAC.3
MEMWSLIYIPWHSNAPLGASTMSTPKSALVEITGMPSRYLSSNLPWDRGVSRRPGHLCFPYHVCVVSLCGPSPTQTRDSLVCQPLSL